MSTDPKITMISPPLAPGHPCRLKRAGKQWGPDDPFMTILARHGAYAWVHADPLCNPDVAPENVLFDDLETALPDVEVQELNEAQMDAAIQRAKLAAAQHLIKVIAKNDNGSLSEMLTRLTLAYKGRIILDPKDDATPEQMAQGLIVSVLMAGIEVSA